MIDNPQLTIEGKEAWRISWPRGVAEVEPFFGKPILNEMAVTTTSVWTFAHHGWRRHEAIEAGIAPAMLRMWLAAKIGWDNERKQLAAALTEIEQRATGLVDSELASASVQEIALIARDARQGVSDKGESQ